MKIAVIGLWHLGTVVSASLAKMGHNVVGFDFDAEKIAEINKDILPVNEPGLLDLIQTLRAQNRIRFTHIAEDLKGCSVVVFAYDTPVAHNDEPDTRPLFRAIAKAARYFGKNILFVVMSQVPVGTTNKLAEAIRENNKGIQVAPVYSPENLQLGKALDCFLKPDRIVIGSDGDKARKWFEEVMEGVPGERIGMDIASAEMCKHALNAFLATSLSFTYTISDLCEATGADILKVMESLKSDKRIGTAAYLDTSLGFSGGTLMRDLRSLSKLSKKYKLNSPVIEGVISTNVRRKALFIKKLKKESGSLKGKRIAIFGVTYKPGTSTLRRSLSVDLIHLLQKEGARISAYDPGATPAEFFDETGIRLSKNAYQAAQGAHMIISVTPWDEFLKLDFNRLSREVEGSCVFFDTRSFFKAQEGKIEKAGFVYRNIGRGLLKKTKLL